MPAGPRELYVYYRVAPPHAEAARLEVLAWQSAALQRWPGLEARLLRRPPAHEQAEQTWMEIYRHPAGLSEAILAQLQQATAQLPALRSGERHLEIFEACTICGLS